MAGQKGLAPALRPFALHFRKAEMKGFFPKTRAEFSLKKPDPGRVDLIRLHQGQEYSSRRAFGPDLRFGIWRQPTNQPRKWLKKHLEIGISEKNQIQKPQDLTEITPLANFFSFSEFLQLKIQF